MAAQKINNDPAVSIYGGVTDGEPWKFGRLIGHTFISNIQSYTVSNLAELFGAIHFVLQLASRGGLLASD